MAITYKNARYVASTSYATAYTCPSGTTALVQMANAANVNASANATASMQWLDSSASNAATRLVPGISVPPQLAQKMLDGPLTLEAGDALQIKGSTANDIELSLTICEIT